VGFAFVSLTVGSFFAGDDEEVVCNVAHVPLHGIVTTTSGGISDLLGMGALSTADDFVATISAVDADETVEAILIDIDSPGGTPVAADEMMGALLSARKPTVVVVRELAASAAYWVAAGADHIIASPVSDVGSIGVTMSYLETASSTDTEGSRWVDISSGVYKDAGHPERPLRGEEQAFFKSQVDTVHEYMVDRIAQARTVWHTWARKRWRVSSSTSSGDLQKRAHGLPSASVQTLRTLYCVSPMVAGGQTSSRTAVDRPHKNTSINTSIFSLAYFFWYTDAHDTFCACNLFRGAFSLGAMDG
jgi:signal peptide peptidase SppA